MQPCHGMPEIKLEDLPRKTRKSSNPPHNSSPKKDCSNCIRVKCYKKKALKNVPDCEYWLGSL